MADINLGHATAYGYARSKGFSGTEEEFAQLMANYGTVGQTATQAAQTATTKASEAASSASNAALSATNAANSAQEAADIVENIIDDTLTQEGKAADAKVTGDEINNLKDDLTYNVGSTLIPKTAGAYIKTDTGTVNINNPVSNASFSYSIVACSEGDVFVVNATGAYAPRAWAFINASGTILSNSALNVTVTNLKLTAPSTAAYLIINDSSGSSSFKGQPLINRVEVLESETSKYNELITPSEYTSIDTSGASAGVLLKPDGTTDTGGSGYIATDYIDISSYYGISITAQMNYAFNILCFYDSNHTFISGITSASGATQTKYVNYKCDIPAGAKYARFGSLTYMYVYGATGIQTFDYLTGKKWACIGDSLTALNDATKMHYYDYIAEQTGITTVNMGQGGTGYKKTEESGTAFYQRVLNIDPTIDVCTVFGSGNDMSLHSNFGTYTDSSIDTVAGCVNTFLDNYFSICPTQPIGIIAPAPWYAFPTTATNNYMEQYTELLKQIAEYRGVPFLDLYHKSNLRPEDSTNRDLCFYSQSLDGHGDGTHPNELGHKIIASKIKAFLDTLLM